MPTVLVTGANRGLGLEFARQYAAEGWEVVGTAREPGEDGKLGSLGVRVEQLDLLDLDAVGHFGSRVERLDLLIANAGTWGPTAIETAEDARRWEEALVVNSIAPVLLAYGLIGKLAGAGGTMVAITSRMGSIADNSSGGYIAYRSSKAALNAAWRSMALDNPQVIAAVFHPGWVRTRMGGQAAPLEVADSVSSLRKTIAGLGRQHSGGFFNHDGAPLPW